MENYERKLLCLLDGIGSTSETLEKAKYITDQIANYFDIVLSSDTEGLILYNFNAQRVASNILEDYLSKLKEIIQSTEQIAEELHQEAISHLEKQHND